MGNGPGDSRKRSRRPHSGPAPQGGRRTAWTRVARSRADAVAARLSTSTAGAFAAGWSAILTLLAVGAAICTAWIFGAGSGSITDAMHVSGISWLATHLIPVSVPEGSISALPMGFVVVPGWLLWRAGQWAARRSGACIWQDVRPMVATGAGVYATIALLVATATANEAAWVTPLAAVIGAGLFAVLVFGAGATREAGLWPSLVDRFSIKMRLRIRAGLIGFGSIIAASAVVLAFALIMHFSAGLTILDALSPGLIGNLLLFILGVAYVPNALVWAAGFCLGTGFSVGEGTVVAPYAVDAAAIPAFPLLAGVPEQANPWMFAAFLIPVLAGGLSTARLSGRRPLPVLDRAAAIERVWVAGITAGLMGVFAWLAGGSFGSGRMTDIGPHVLLLVIATFCWMFVGGLIGDQVRRLRNWWQVRRSAGDVDLRSSTSDFLDISGTIR